MKRRVDSLNCHDTRCQDTCRSTTCCSCHTVTTDSLTAHGTRRKINRGGDRCCCIYVIVLVCNAPACDFSENNSCSLTHPNLHPSATTIATGTAAAVPPLPLPLLASPPPRGRMLSRSAHETIQAVIVGGGTLAMLTSFYFLFKAYRPSAAGTEGSA